MLAVSAQCRYLVDMVLVIQIEVEPDEKYDTECHPDESEPNEAESVRYDPTNLTAVHVEKVKPNSFLYEGYVTETVAEAK